MSTTSTSISTGTGTGTSTSTGCTGTGTHGTRQHAPPRPRLDVFTLIDAFVRSAVWCLVLVYVSAGICIMIGHLHAESVAMRAASAAARARLRASASAAATSTTSAMHMGAGYADDFADVDVAGGVAMVADLAGLAASAAAGFSPAPISALPGAFLFAHVP